ncbi:hypothetical protein DSO57_1038028 [Entomophthora muscae]|uniref:Uncharacterized protein n=1 Tax=Entomophthora muscae TaxID=34485 RepID=A0ACC2TKW1_9FUNG|nr:hypothetical protein DSO57_1038028 [Entomophthora muscae]
MACRSRYLQGLGEVRFPIPQPPPFRKWVGIGIQPSRIVSGIHPVVGSCKV